MTVEDYLKNDCKVDLGYIASEMYPSNKSAISYLSKKLNKKDNRTFTKKDGELAINALKKLSIEISSLTID